MASNLFDFIPPSRILVDTLHHSIRGRFSRILFCSRALSLTSRVLVGEVLLFHTIDASVRIHGLSKGMSLSQQAIQLAGVPQFHFYTKVSIIPLFALRYRLSYLLF